MNLMNRSLDKANKALNFGDFSFTKKVFGDNEKKFLLIWPIVMNKSRNRDYLRPSTNFKNEKYF